MNSDRINQLMDRYLEGETSLEEEAELRSLLQREDLPKELEPARDLFDWSGEVRRVRPSTGFDPFARLPGEGDRSSPSDSKFHRWSLRIAAGVILLLTGFAGGLLLDRQTGSEEVAALQQEVEQMKQVLISGYRPQSSASERISMINMSSDLAGGDASDREIREILIVTMNSDASVNVRMAAAEELFRYRDQPSVREAMVRSLPHQSEPVMQIALIRMLVEMNEKGAISEMEKMLMNSETRDVVRPMLETGLAELKTI